MPPTGVCVELTVAGTSLPVLATLGTARSSLASRPLSLVRAHREPPAPPDAHITLGNSPLLRASSLARVLERILDADHAAGQQLLAGHRISKWVPTEPLPPLPTPANPIPLDDYRTLRPPSTALLLPLLLNAVDLSPLRPFQRTGVQWLQHTPAAILADDMGLGKTVQATVALQLLVRSTDVFQALLVLPRSLLATWEDELSKWAPELTRLRITPRPHERAQAWQLLLGRVHVLLTNYEQLRDPPEPLLQTHLDLLIADEAHRIRNLDAKTTQGMRQLRWARCWALTGTPIERDPTDLATLLSTLAPRRFSPSDGQIDAGVLRSRARPYILRRSRADVLPDLPDILPKRETLDLTPAQAKSYRATARRVPSHSNPDADFLKTLNRLRTICDYDPDTRRSSKADRLVELLDDISRSKEKAVVFSYLLDPLFILQDLLKSTSISTELITGQMTLDERHKSLATFKNQDDVTALLASTRIAGEGLTLTEANHVLFFNEWWNPSSNRQARDRVVRIGQRRGVRVYTFTCRGTVEESLVDILRTKSKQYAEILGQLATTVDPNSNADVRTLVTDIRDDISSQGSGI